MASRPRADRPRSDLLQAVTQIHEKIQLNGGAHPEEVEGFANINTPIFGS